MDDVAAIVEAELGSAPERVERVEEGLLHETYLVDCGGDEYVLQFGSDREDGRRDSLRRGHFWYVALADSPVPVPDVVTETPRTREGRTYTLVERLPGETGHLDLSPERTRDAGRSLARVHDAWRFDRSGWIRIEDGRPSVDPFEAGSLTGRIRHAVGENARTLRDEGLERAGDAVESLFDRVGAALPEVFRPVLCHDDFSPDNVLYEGDEVTGIVDFDRAYAGHHQRDLVAAGNAFWMHDPGADWDVRATLYEGYREVRPLGRSFERNEPRYRVETLAETVAGCLELDVFSGDEREFYDERIVEAVERAEGA